MICAKSTYQLSFTQFESDVCKATLTVNHRLPPGFRSEISPTCPGHNGLATSPTRVIQTTGHNGMATSPTRVIQTRTRKRTKGTNVGLWPTQWDWGKVRIKGIILNCFTSICRIKQSSVSWLHCIDCMYQECTYHIFPYWRLLVVSQV